MNNSRSDDNGGGGEDDDDDDDQANSATHDDTPYSDTVYTWCFHHDKVIAVHLMNIEQRQAAAEPHTKPNDLGLGCESASRLPSPTSTIAILLLLNPKAGSHFTVIKYT